MALFNHFFWAIFCLCNAIHGLKKPQRTIIPSLYDARQILSSQELQTGNDQESKELINNKNFFTEQTLLENVGSKYTKPTAIDTLYEYDNSVLTRAIKFRTDSFTSDLNNAQKYDIPTKSNPKYNKKKYQSLQNVMESEDIVEDRDKDREKVSELDSPELNPTENQFLELKPARRIYNGHKTKIKHFPFLVTVHVFRQFVCGGSIIKPNLVITAASCLKRWQEWMRHHTTSTTVNETTTNQTTPSHTITKNETKKIVTTKIVTTKIVTTKNVTTKIVTKKIVTKKIVTTKNVTANNVTTKHVTANNVTTKNLTTASVTTKHFTANNVTTKNLTTANVTTHHNLNYTIPTKPTHITVRIGTNYYRLDGKVVEVVKVHFHPSYQEENFRNNLVILELEIYLSFEHRNIKKIDIRTNATGMVNGTDVTIIGWGAETYHNKVYNALWNLIHKAKLTVINSDQCIKTYTSEFVDNATNFCASNQDNEGACKCDAGDPAVADGVLVGVTSFGSSKCGAPNATTVFTNLGYYTDWIKEIMFITKENTTGIPKNATSKGTTRSEMTTSRTYVWPCLRNRYPFYGSGEKCQEEPRGYRRALEDTTQTLKLEEKKTDSDINRRVLTISPVRLLTNSKQYEYRSGNIGPEKSMSSEENARIENNFLLTPKAPEKGYHTIV